LGKEKVKPTWDKRGEFWDRDDLTSQSSRESIANRNIFDPPVEQHHFRFSKFEDQWMRSSEFTIERIRSKVSRDMESDLLTERRGSLVNTEVNTGNHLDGRSEK
jgi:hypothetical protein